MPFAILMLDSNYLTSAKHSPKKWNVNYITITGLDEEELSNWVSEYGEDWSSVDSELFKELAVIRGMLNTLEDFGYTLISSMTSNPRIAYKDTENNRECYIWTLYKGKGNSVLEMSDESPPNGVPPDPSSFMCEDSSPEAVETVVVNPPPPPSMSPAHSCCCCRRGREGVVDAGGSGTRISAGDIETNPNPPLPPPPPPTMGPSALEMSKEIEHAFKIMSVKEKQMRALSETHQHPGVGLVQREARDALEFRLEVTQISEI